MLHNKLPIAIPNSDEDTGLDRNCNIEHVIQPVPLNDSNSPSSASISKLCPILSYIPTSTNTETNNKHTKDIDMGEMRNRCTNAVIISDRIDREEDEIKAKTDNVSPNRYENEKRYIDTEIGDGDKMGLSFGTIPLGQRTPLMNQKVMAINMGVDLSTTK